MARHEWVVTRWQPPSEDEAELQRWAEEVAEFTRLVFSSPGRSPGPLPPTEGSRETAANVLEDLRRQCRFWVARGLGGELAGTVRAQPTEGGTWQLRRLGVAPASRSEGLGALLVRAVERGARAEGVSKITLQCVVERLLPSFYGRLGYDIVRREPHSVKPTTVVTMVRDVGRAAASAEPDAGTGRRGPARRRVAHGWSMSADRALPERGVYVLWLWLGRPVRLPMLRPTGSELAAGLYAYAGSAQRGLPSRLGRHVEGRGTRRPHWHIDHLRAHAVPAGADVWPGAPASGQCRMAALLAQAGGTRIAGFGATDCGCEGHLARVGDGTGTPAPSPFVTPRLVEPGLVAVFRTVLPSASRDGASPVSGP